MNSLRGLKSWVVGHLECGLPATFMGQDLLAMHLTADIAKQKQQQ